MGRLSFEHAKLVRDCFYTHQDQINTFAYLSAQFPLASPDPSERDDRYFLELMGLMRRENVWIYDTYADLCALERRYCSVLAAVPEPLGTLEGSVPVLFLISGLKVFFGYHVLDLFAVMQDKALLLYSRLKEAPMQTDLQDTLREGKCEQVGEPRDVNEAALEPFAVLASRCLSVLSRLSVAAKDADSLLAVLFSLSFAPAKVDWDIAVEFVSELLEKYMESDDPRVKGFQDLLGVQLYTLCRAGALQSERLRRIGELCIGHYMKQVENWDLDFIKLKESVDRQEYSKNNLEASELAIKELSTLHDVFRFSVLPTVEYQMQTAWETLVKYQWARKTLKSLEDS